MLTENLGDRNKYDLSSSYTVGRNRVQNATHQEVDGGALYRFMVLRHDDRRPSDRPFASSEGDRIRPPEETGV